MPDNARKFDIDATHGVQHMKRVDFIIELSDKFLFIEVKEPEDAESMKSMKGWSRQFRDSFLYEWAEGRANKPIDYIVLVVLDELTSADLVARTDALWRRLPVRGPEGRPWKRPFVATCAVMNLAIWNRHELTKKFPATRVS